MKKIAFFIVFFYFLAILLIFAQNNTNNTNFNHQIQYFLSILGKIESNNNDFAVGDGGKALGRYQIHEIYFKDAQKIDKTLKNVQYHSVTNKEIADRVVVAYIKKYNPNGSLEEWARLHNGGPNWKNKTGKAKENLNKYWARFHKEK